MPACVQGHLPTAAMARAQACAPEQRSQSPAETVLRRRAQMAGRVSIAQWAQPGVGSPGPSRAATLSEEFKLCIYQRGAVTTALPASPRHDGRMS